MEAFGDRIAYAVTLNEPNLPRLLTWVDLPQFVRDLERATLEAASAAAGVERLSAGNVDAARGLRRDARTGMTAGHLAAKAAIKARRADLPVGLSHRDHRRRRSSATTRRCATASAPRSTTTGSSSRADDDFVGVQNYERRLRTTAPVRSPPIRRAAGTTWASAIEPALARRRRPVCLRRSGVPVLVTEHGMSTDDDTLRAGFIEPAARAACSTRSTTACRCSATALDADGQLRVDLRVRRPARPGRGRPRRSTARRSRAPTSTAHIARANAVEP